MKHRVELPVNKSKTSFVCEDPADDDDNDASDRRSLRVMARRLGNDIDRAVGALDKRHVQHLRTHPTDCDHNAVCLQCKAHHKKLEALNGLRLGSDSPGLALFRAAAQVRRVQCGAVKV